MYSVYSRMCTNVYGCKWDDMWFDTKWEMNSLQFCKSHSCGYVHMHNCGLSFYPYTDIDVVCIVYLFCKTKNNWQYDDDDDNDDERKL